MTDRRRRRAASDDHSVREENPFAPPPEGRPDQPWQPRHREDGQEGSDDRDGHNGSSSGNSGSSGNSSNSGPEGGRSSWGSRWSSRQPKRGSGGFGSPRGEQGGDSSGPQGPGKLRWDPTDPMQRRARYALHAGIWGLFFALFSLLPVGLLLAALSVYWGVTALRAKNRPGAGESDGSGRPAATAEDVAGTGGEGERRENSSAAQALRAQVSPAQAARTQVNSAIGGLVMAGLTLAVIGATFAFQQIYSDYFVCEQDALTQSSREECRKMLPEEIRPFLESGESANSSMPL